MKKEKMKILLITLCAVSASWAADTAQVYQKARFLDEAKGKTGEAVGLYRQVAAAEVTDKNRAVVIKSLTRLLEIYQSKEVKPNDLNAYLAKLNLDFEKGQVGPSSKLPKYWFGGGEGYLRTVEQRQDKLNDSCGKITRTGDKGMFGTFTNSLDPKIFRGKKVEISGWMKLKEVEGAVGLWLRSDAEKRVATFYNMNDQKINGTRDWKRYSFEIEIPSEVTNINFGALLSGGGTMWVDDLDVKIVETK